MARDSSFAGGCMGAMFGMGIVAMLGIALCGGCLFVGGSALNEIGKEAAKQDRKLNSKLTLANFNSVKTGMTYEQVTELLGDRCELASENRIAGIHTELYIWKSSFGPNCNVMFQNGKAVQKAQFGLR